MYGYVILFVIFNQIKGNYVNETFPKKSASWYKFI